MRRPWGTTLLELVIVFSLLSTLLALVAMYFVRGQHYTMDTESYSSLQREAILTIRRMREQLTRSTERHIGVDEVDQSFVYFLSFRSDNPNDPYIEFGGPESQVIWKKWVCFFHDAEQEEALQADIPLATPTFSLLTKPLPDVSLSSFQAAQQKTLGRQIRSLTFHTAENVILISLSAVGESPVPGRTAEDKVLEIHLNSKVTLTN